MQGLVVATLIVILAGAHAKPLNPQASAKQRGAVASVDSLLKMRRLGANKPVKLSTSSSSSSSSSPSATESCKAPKGYTFYQSQYVSSPEIDCFYLDGRTTSDLDKQCKETSKCKSISTYTYGGDDIYCLFSTVGPTFSLPSQYLNESKCYGSYISGPAPPVPYMTQWGGAIMAKTVNVYMIYVGGYAACDNTPKTLNSFVANLGGSDWWRLNTRYSMDPPHVPKRTFASGDIKLAGSYYIPSTSGLGVAKSNILEDVGVSVQTLIKRKVVPWDADNGIYVVISKSGQYDSKSTTCLDRGYCGWHFSWSQLATDKYSKLKYAFIPDEDCWACNSPDSLYENATSPTGSAQLDGVISVIAHELTETVTDPQIDAWQDIYGEENADLCAWTFGTPNVHVDCNGKKVAYNAVVGNQPYMLQRNYDPSINPKTKLQWGCVYGVDRSGATMADKPSVLPATYKPVV